MIVPPSTGELRLFIVMLDTALICERASFSTCTLCIIDLSSSLNPLTSALIDCIDAVVALSSFRELFPIP